MNRIVLLFALTLAACMPTAVRKPTTVTYDVFRRPEVFNAVVALVASQGYPITFSDAGSGTVTTQVVQQPDTLGCGIMTCQYRQNLALTVKADGTIAVNINRELKGAEGDWFVPNTNGQINDVIKAQTAIAEEIASSIGGRVSPTP